MKLNDYNFKSMSKDQRTKTVTHEFGHALGLDHTHGKYDVMQQGQLSITSLSSTDKKSYDEAYRTYWYERKTYMNKQFNIKKIISIIFSLFIVLATVSCSKENINKESKVEYMRGDFAVDVENPYELVGYSDYYFIGEVISQKNTEYRDPINVETENGTEEVTSPYTNYEIKVIKNIKGNLPMNKNITITKAGGLSETGDLVLYENDSLPDVGKAYVMTASAQPDGSLLVSGPNSSKLFDQITTRSSNSDRYDRYNEIYNNQVEFNRERFQFKDNK